ncbi:MAG: hypothetical protein IKR25_03485 [Muribaculaceae bacterium]|nr:hypothetical protein [Muribaculaceae bacterium]
MSKRITVVGAANVDITAAPLDTYRGCESNPSRVTIGFGGVGRNIAHNLRLLAHEVRFVTVFGDDAIAHTLLNDCRRLGMTIDPVITIDHARSNYFICINDERGEMQAGAADMELMDALTVKTIAPHMTTINAGDATVVDCNVCADVLQHLWRHCTTPLYVDATSMAKAMRLRSIIDTPRQVSTTLKLNRSEAEVLTGIAGDVQTMARALTAHGSTHVYITMGAEGVCCSDGHDTIVQPAKPVKVVNATGAGDAFMAALIAAEVKGLPMAQAAACGIEAAAIALQCPTAVSKLIVKLQKLIK